jgi:hypothetical protein
MLYKCLSTFPPPFEDLRQYSRASAGDKITPIRWLKHSKPCSSKCLSTSPPPFEDLRQYSRASAGDKITPIHPLAEALEAMLFKVFVDVPPPSRTSGDSLRGPQGKTFESLRVRHSRTSGDSLREPQGKTFESLSGRQDYSNSSVG